MKMLRYAVGLFCLAWTACGTQGASDVESDGISEAPIVGGAATRGDPAVVGLTSKSGRLFCSGTLVSPTHVITAGHCIEDRRTGAAAKPAWIFICPTTTKTTPTNHPECFLSTASAVVYPGYKITDGKDMDAVEDIAVVTLSKPTTIKPKKLPTAPLPKSAVGSKVRVVGYGADDGERQTGTGQKRSAIATLTFVGPEAAGSTGPNSDGLPASAWQMSGDPGTCNGDSGGPAFWPVGNTDSETLVGVTSTGDQDCKLWGADTNVGSFLCWLKEVGVPGASCN